MTNSGPELPDPLLRYPYYVKAWAFYDAVIEDTSAPVRDKRWRVIVGQLVRAAGSISANIEEGYGRGTPPAGSGLPSGCWPMAPTRFTTWPATTWAAPA